MEPRIADLAALAPEDESRFGGKAVGLARLIAAGARVPPGIAVEATGLPPSDWPGHATAELRRRSDALLARGARCLAVRSSAIGEDSAARSFAGMFETVLDVDSGEGAVEASARVVASSKGDRVRSYAGAAPPVGVVVQVQIEATASGVCFTADPAGRDRAVVVEAVPGAGEALVSGKAQPEAWRVYRSGLGRWEPRRERSGAPVVLDGARVSALAAEALRLADCFGHPLDLEWAFDRGGDLFWLQARPITAAQEPPALHVERIAPEADDGPVTVWANWNVRETLPDPFPPLAWALWRDMILPTALEPLVGVPRSSPLFRQLIGVDLVQGRLYWNMNALFGTAFGLAPIRRLLRAIDPQAFETAEALEAEGVLGHRRVPFSRRRLLLGTVRKALVSGARLLGALRPVRVLRDIEACAAAVAGRPPLGSLGDEELIREIRLFEHPDLAPIRHGMNALFVSIVVYTLAHRAFRAHREALDLLTTGIAGNPTTQISLSVDALAEAARPVADAFREGGEPEAVLRRVEGLPGGAAWLNRFGAFLERFGHRGPQEFDLHAPRWREDPRMILDLVRARLVSLEREGVAERLERLAESRRQAIAAAVASAPPWRRPVLRTLAYLVEQHMPLREAPKHHAMVVFERTRRAILELGARLWTRGVLASADDAFFLDWPEAGALLVGQPITGDPRKLVDERRARYERERAVPAPSFIRSDGVPVAEPEAHSPPGAALRGKGVSAGRAAGPVRVLLEPDPNAMADGDVLVLAFADPGWTPLFPRAAAVVMEVGGALCHAAVVARELGIPGVFGVAGATRLLSNGERVIVDGREGTVERA